MVISRSLSSQEDNSQQSSSEMVLKRGEQTVACQSIQFREGVVLARPMSEHSGLSISVLGTEEKNEPALDNIQHPVILATLDEIKLCFLGEWVVETLSLSETTTLFTFLDYQAEHRGIKKVQAIQPSNTLFYTTKQVVLKIEDTNKSFVRLILSSILDPQNNQLASFFSFIRNIERYWISHFLLSQVMSKDKENDMEKIYKACQTYGVSESYFRKLCHQAFTRGPKKQIRLWRAANSALQLIEKDYSISDIAGSNGYSSSSHLSSELKSLFGFTPKEFKKLEGLLND